MRIQKLGVAWLELSLRSQKSILEGAVLIAKCAQMDQENVASLDEISRSIDQIAERVAELVGNCSQKSPKRTIAFINQVLYAEMGFESTAREQLPFENFYIDRV